MLQGIPVMKNVHIGFLMILSLTYVLAPSPHTNNPESPIPESGLKRKKAYEDEIQRNAGAIDEYSDLDLSRLQRVIGGDKVKEGHWPWLVSIQAKIPKQKFLGITISYDVLYCGASLIAQKWLLTAAHCFKYKGTNAKNPKFWHARLGDVDLKPTAGERIKGVFGKIFGRDEWRDWTIHIDKIFLHPKYDEEGAVGIENDLALVHLQEDVPLGSDIQFVRLPVPNITVFPSKTDECVAKGWGCIKGGGAVSEVARQIHIPVLDNALCRRMWDISATSRICAGFLSQQKGVCQGDSGGPLVCRHGDLWILVGVASFGHQKDPGDYPAVFSRVSHYIDWIYNVMTKNN